MEYLEGETVADRLKKGALPLEQVLRYGIEIAGALDKAHCHGIVHRDLKPGNVILTKSGAKLVDFGLAKLRVSDTPVSAASELSALPTGEKPLTAEDSLVGTFQYMAPEQLEGKEPDARADMCRSRPGCSVTGGSAAGPVGRARGGLALPLERPGHFLSSS